MGLTALLYERVLQRSYYVHELIYWLDREWLEDNSYKELKSIFSNEEYKTFRKLDYNSYRGKQDYDFETHNEFIELKEKEIREGFIFKSENDFHILHTAILNILSLGKDNSWDLQEPLNIIHEENFIRDEELGFKLMESFLANYPSGIHPLDKPIKLITASNNYYLKFWKLIKNWNHSCKLSWQLTFFKHLPTDYINKTFAKELIDTINSIDKSCSLHFDSFEKFESINKDIVKEILEIVNRKNAEQNLKISLQHGFFEKYITRLKDNLDLVFEAYIYKDSTSNDFSFDFERKDLKSIVELNPDFMVEYITLFYGNDNFINRNRNNNLTFIWDLDNPKLVEQLVEIIISKNPYTRIGKYILSIFFNHLTESQKQKAEEFISYFITANNSDRNKMNAIFDVVRHFLNEKLEKYLLLYLTFNTNIESFKNIYWIGNGRILHGGDVNLNELKATDWKRIDHIIVKAENQLQLIPIKSYVRGKIEYSLKYTEEERKIKFVNPDW